VSEAAIKTRLAGVAAVESIAFQASLPEGMDTGEAVRLLEPLRIKEQLIFAGHELVRACHDTLH
jgi:hypothetical protein